MNAPSDKTSIFCVFEGSSDRPLCQRGQNFKNETEARAFFDRMKVELPNVLLHLVELRLSPPAGEWVMHVERSDGNEQYLNGMELFSVTGRPS